MRTKKVFDPGIWWSVWPLCSKGCAMGRVLHGSATTTKAVRRAIQRRQEGVRALAQRYGVSPATIQKWRKCETTADARMGPKEVRSTVLTPEEEAIVVAFRRHTLLPLDDGLHGLQPTIPRLTRSSLHRCLEQPASPGCPQSRATSPRSSVSRATPSAMSILQRQILRISATAPKSAQRKASCACSWPSTAPASSPSSVSSKAQARCRPQGSCASGSKRCPTASHRAHRQWHPSEAAERFARVHHAQPGHPRRLAHP